MIIEGYRLHYGFVNMEEEMAQQIIFSIFFRLLIKWNTKKLSKILSDKSKKEGI